MSSRKSVDPVNGFPVLTMRIFLVSDESVKVETALWSGQQGDFYSHTEGLYILHELFVSNTERP